MSKPPTLMTASSQQESTALGSFVRILGQDFYQIQNYDKIAPFLMSIVSVGDHWMYVSSTGGLTAGRISAENCLFPYETVDRLYDCHPYTGPTTIIRRRGTSGEFAYWQPFIDGTVGSSVKPRRLMKHVTGDQVIFEEANECLGLTFRYSWRTSTQFGFIRTATLKNTGSRDIEIELVDGLRNLCPGGVPLFTSLHASCLVDAK